MSDELFLSTLENVWKLPSIVYKKMGPFGRMVTMPLWIVFTPLFALTSLGPLSFFLLSPLWIFFFIMTPVFLVVIVVEHGVHDLAKSWLGVDIRWMRKRTQDEKERPPRPGERRKFGAISPKAATTSSSAAENSRTTTSYIATRRR